MNLSWTAPVKTLDSLQLTVSLRNLLFVVQVNTLLAFRFSIAQLPGCDRDIPSSHTSKKTSDEILKDTYWRSVFHARTESLEQIKLPVVSSDLKPFGQTWFSLVGVWGCRLTQRFVTQFGFLARIKSVLFELPCRNVLLCHGYQKQNPKHTFYWCNLKWNI